MLENDKHLLMFFMALCTILFPKICIRNACCCLYFFILVACSFLIVVSALDKNMFLKSFFFFFLTECIFEHKTNSHVKKKMTVVKISFRCLTCKLDEEGH